MVCKAFLESLESSNFVWTIMKSLTANQQDLLFTYFLLKSGRPEDGQTGRKREGRDSHWSWCGESWSKSVAERDSTFLCRPHNSHWIHSAKNSVVKQNGSVSGTIFEISSRQRKSRITSIPKCFSHKYFEFQEDLFWWFLLALGGLQGNKEFVRLKKSLHEFDVHL